MYLNLAVSLLATAMTALLILVFRPSTNPKPKPKPNPTPNLNPNPNPNQAAWSPPANISKWVGGAFGDHGCEVP